MRADLRRKVEVTQWLFWQMGGLGPMAGQNHHFSQYAPTKIPYAIDRYVSETNRLYGVLNRRLADRAFVAGEYSIADMATYPWIVPYERQGQNLQDFPHLKRWFENIKARPAVVRAYAKAKEINTQPTVTEESKRILLDRRRQPSRAKGHPFVGRQLYDLAGAEAERRFSPYCWRTKMALIHKGLPFDTIPWRFNEKSVIAFSGQGRVPVLSDGDQVVSDSWTIATYLEDAIQIVRHCFVAREAARLPGLSMPGRMAFWLAGSCVWSSPTSSRISIRRTALTFARREKSASARSWRRSALIGKRMCQHSARPWSRFAPCLQPSPIWAVRCRPTPIMPFSAVSSGRDASVHSHCCLRTTRCGRGAIGCFRHLADLPAKRLVIRYDVSDCQRRTGRHSPIRSPIITQSLLTHHQGAGRDLRRGCRG